MTIGGIRSTWVFIYFNAIFLTLSNKFIVFYTLLLYYYINLRSLTTCCLFSEDIYVYISFFWYFSMQSCIFCFTFNCLQTILWWSDFNINQIAICFICFLNCSFSNSFKSISSRLLAWSRSFWMYLQLKFLTMFLTISLLILFAKNKNP